MKRAAILFIRGIMIVRKKLRVIIPDSRILELFQTKTDYLTRYQKNLEKENQLLIAIRDHLLPLVMSGEL